MLDVGRRTSEARRRISDARRRISDARRRSSDARRRNSDARRRTSDARPLADTSHSDAGRQTPDAANFGASEPRNFNSTRAFHNMADNEKTLEAINILYLARFKIKPI